MKKQKAWVLEMPEGKGLWPLYTDDLEREKTKSNVAWLLLAKYKDMTEGDQKWILTLSERRALGRRCSLTHFLKPSLSPQIVQLLLNEAFVAILTSES